MASAVLSRGLGRGTALLQLSLLEREIYSHKSEHMSCGAHTSAYLSLGEHTSARMCAFYAPGPYMHNSQRQIYIRQSLY